MKPRKGEFGDLHGVGGAACLDFVNTVSGCGTAIEFDRLEGYGDLPGWAHAVGLLTNHEAKSLVAAGRSDPERAQACFGRALEFRDAIYRSGLGVLNGTPAPSDHAPVVVDLT